MAKTSELKMIRLKWNNLCLRGKKGKTTRINKQMNEKMNNQVNE